MSHPKSPEPPSTTGRTHSKSFRDAARRHAIRSDQGFAFVHEPGSGIAPSDEVAEELAEEFLISATSGEEVGEEALDAVSTEEQGGPFVVTPARLEFAAGTDASNPFDAEPAALPTATGKGST